MRIEKFLKTSPLFGLYLAYDQIVEKFQERLAGEDVHFVQALILTGMFFEERAVRPGELAETFCCSRSNISHSLRDLEKKGLLERSVHRSDARAYFLNLTRAGRRKAPRLIKIFDSTEAHLEKCGGKSLLSELELFLARAGHETT